MEPRNNGTAQGASSKACGGGMFRLGQLAMTAGARHVLDANNTHYFELIARHVHGDFGDLCEDDRALNVAAIAVGDRILSSYQIGGEKFYVITEWDRSVTTVLLASEY